MPESAKTRGALIYTDFITLAKERSPASDFYYEYAHITRSSSTANAEKTALLQAGFRCATFVEQRVQFKRNFEYGLKRLGINEKRMKSEFGNEKYAYMESMYRNALRPEFLADLSWAWFKAEK